VGDRTRQAVYGLVHRVLEYAVETEKLGRNPCATVKPPKLVRTERRALTPSEIGYLLRAVRGDRLEALIVLALTTTCGPGELFALRRRDVHLAERYIEINGDLVETAAHGYRPTVEPTKNPKRRRRIVLSAIAVDALRERLKLCLAEGGGEFVFTSPGGAPIRLSNLRRNWWLPLLCRAADLAEANAREAGDTGYRFPRDLRFYEMRHSAASLMLHLGVPIEIVSKRMGHASVSTMLAVYAHLCEGADRVAAEKLDAFFEHIGERGAAVGQ
jgi:integrase